MKEVTKKINIYQLIKQPKNFEKGTQKERKKIEMEASITYI